MGASSPRSSEVQHGHGIMNGATLLAQLSSRRDVFSLMGFAALVIDTP